MGRPVSIELDNILGKEFKLLDHGFIRVLDYMGNQDTVAESARVSYQQGTKSKRDNKGLLRYLIRHHHHSPLEMCEIRFHIKLPMFVARQWIRHRTANVNEMSARYSVLPDEFYVPDKANISAQSKSNKQGRESNEHFDSKHIQDILSKANDLSYSIYDSLIDDGDLSREIARSVLPVAMYTEWIWKIDLRNLLHFIQLRADSHAQYEIRVYAEVMKDIVNMWCPDIMEAFDAFAISGQTFSSEEIETLLSALDFDKITDSFIKSKSEYKEFIDKIKV
jgi:thymidylate synthase (FAD)